jgi:hypothetical protein
MQYQSKG